MKHPRATVFDFFGDAALTIMCLLGVYGSWQAGYYLATLLLVGLSALALWNLITLLRQGWRAPTRLEHFEQRLFVRAIVVLVVGGLLLVIGGQWVMAETTPWPPALKLIVLAAICLAYAVTSLYALGRIRNRSESVGAYKRRTGYRDSRDSD
jgi:hypothetical protein